MVSTSTFLFSIDGGIKSMCAKILLLVQTMPCGTLCGACAPLWCGVRCLCAAVLVRCSAVQCSAVLCCAGPDCALLLCCAVPFPAVRMVLCCAVRCCAVPCCAGLCGCHAELCCAVPNCAVPCRAVPYQYFRLFLFCHLLSSCASSLSFSFFVSEFSLLPLLYVKEIKRANIK